MTRRGEYGTLAMLRARLRDPACIAPSAIMDARQDKTSTLQAQWAGCLLLGTALGLAACSDNAVSTTGCEVSSSAPNDALMDPIALSERLFRNMACGGCHSLDGTRRAGPTLLGIFQTLAELEDGTTVLRDESYLRTSLIDPGVHVVKGFPNNMATYEKMLSEEDIVGLISLIRSLRE